MNFKPKHFAWLAIVPLALAACGSDGSAGSGDEESRSWSLATAGTGGTFYAYGGAISTQLSSEVSGLSLSATSTGGSEENIRLLANDDVQIAQAQAPAVVQSFNGEAAFEGDAQDIRILSVMYPDIVQLTALQDSGLSSYQDLVGASVSVGEPGSGVQLTMDVIADATGVSYDDYGDTSRLGFDEQVAGLRNGQLDVGSFMGPPGMSSLQDLSSSKGIAILPFSEQEMSDISSQAEYITSGELPANTYDGQTETVSPLPSQWNYIVVPADMDDDLVTEMALSLFENTDALARAVPAASNTTAENTAEHAAIPLHPGTVAALEQLDVDVPGDATSK